MGLFDILFGKPKSMTNNKQLNLAFSTLSGYSPVYTSHDGGVYELGLCKACIHSIATECAKAYPVLTQKNDRINFIVSKSPNDYMTASQFYYRLATIYQVENNAFIIPIYDEFGKTIGLYPVVPSTVELRESNNVVYVVYTFSDGKRYSIEYSRIGHIKRMQYKDDFFGDSNNAFKTTADLLKAQEVGSKNAIDNSADLQFMAKVNDQLIDEEDMRAQQELLSMMNLNSVNKSGVFIYDNRFEEMKEINHKPLLLDAEQKNAIDNSVFNYWGVNEDILQNKYDEDTWNAFYESQIEPFFIQVGEVLSSMFYSRDQRMKGNEVVLTSDRLQYASNTTKIQVAKEFVDRGLITLNQALKIMNMPPLSDGDYRIVRAEYINANGVGKEEKEHEQGNANTFDDGSMSDSNGNEEN